MLFYSCESRKLGLNENVHLNDVKIDEIRSLK